MKSDISDAMELIVDVVKNVAKLKPCEYSIACHIKYVVKDQNQGFSRIRGENRFISIPLWAYRKGEDYFSYYVCHELSHQFANGFSHDKKFYKVFKRICPENIQHFELEYKPRNAKAAGIKEKTK